MSDVFISYARSTAKQAQQVAEALRGLGYSVWIDADLPAHRTYSRVIEEQMAAAKAAVVIWSADAVQSEWVLSEANRAREDHKLVQAITDTSRLPMPFDTIQCADLTGWTGDLEAPGWRKVAASVDDLVGGAGVASAPAADAPLDVGFEYEGEMPPELALEPERRENFPFMRLSGPANVLVMPAIHSASISTKLVQTLGEATVVGPILLGLSHSVQICPLSASVSKILNMAMMAAFDSPLVETADG